MLILGYVLSVAYGLFCILLGFIAYKLGMAKKYTRKLVHMLVGFEWIILNHFMGAGIHFLIVCLAFTAFLAVSHFAKLTPMMESEGDNSPGTVFYGVAMSIMAFICLFVPEMQYPFGIGVFCTSLGDGFAGVVGQMIRKGNPKIFGNKSLFGTLAAFAVSSLVAFVMNAVFSMGLSPWSCLAIGLFSAGIELVGFFGLDNIGVTLGASLLSYALINVPIFGQFIIPIILTPFIIAAVIEKKALTPAAVFLAVVLDIVVSVALGNFGFILLLVFLVGSVLIDKIKDKKRADDGITKRGSCRDSVQVVANGLIPMLMAIFFAIKPSDGFVLAYVAVLAEAFADTAASGIGVFSRETYDIFKFRKCEKGISGGVSVIGTLAALLVSFVIPLLAAAFGMISIIDAVIAAALAFAGVMFDSLLGSLLQVKYRCAVCGKVTEREIHCDKVTEKISGFAFFDNDVVNLFSGIFAAALALLVFGV